MNHNPFSVAQVDSVSSARFGREAFVIILSLNSGDVQVTMVMVTVVVALIASTRRVVSVVIASRACRFVMHVMVRLTSGLIKDARRTVTGKADTMSSAASRRPDGTIRYDGTTTVGVRVGTKRRAIAKTR